MCKYCEGEEPLISTGCISGHNIDVGIYKDKIIAESKYDDSFGITETVQKACQIRYCPWCGDGLNYSKGAEE